MRRYWLLILILVFAAALIAQAKMSLDDLKREAAKGDVNAMFDLASRYYFADGVAKDLNLAAKWYLSAAEKGHTSAQFGIAACFEDGQG